MCTGLGLKTRKVNSWKPKIQKPPRHNCSLISISTCFQVCSMFHAQVPISLTLVPHHSLYVLMTSMERKRANIHSFSRYCTWESVPPPNRHCLRVLQMWTQSSLATPFLGACGFVIFKTFLYWLFIYLLTYACMPQFTCGDQKTTCGSGLFLPSGF